IPREAASRSRKSCLLITSLPDSDPNYDTDSNPSSEPLLSDPFSEPNSNSDSDGTPALRARSLSPQFLTPTDLHSYDDSPLSKCTPALRARPISPLFAALYGAHYDTPSDPLSDTLSDNDESPVTEGTPRLKFAPIDPLYASFYGTPSDNPSLCDLISSTNRWLTVDHNSNRRDDCKAQTSGYSGAQFKSFNTSQEAMEYMGGGGGGQRSHGTNGNSSSLTAAGGDTYDNFDDDDDFAGDTIYGRPVSQIRSSGHSEPRFEMYTDGACHGNGMAGARAGIGVHFPNRPDKDISEPLAGRQTNNRAEIQAARRALEVAKELGHSRVEIKTDSEFMNKSVNEWSHKWRQNNWRTSAGNDVINKQDFLDLEAASRGMDIKWVCL
ncbi:unnamed protein product, partial [Medioppia subpectinata]